MLGVLALYLNKWHFEISCGLSLLGPVDSGIFTSTRRNGISFVLFRGTGLVVNLLKFPTSTGFVDSCGE